MSDTREPFSHKRLCFVRSTSLGGFAATDAPLAAVLAYAPFLATLLRVARLRTDSGGISREKHPKPLKRLGIC